MMIPGLTNAYPNGIGGEASNAGETIDDVAEEGCLCHGNEPSNSVMVILVDVPYTWTPGAEYPMRLEVIGGPDTDMGGFSARVNSGELSGDGQPWEGDSKTRTHVSSSTRIFELIWTAPEAGAGTVDFWISGNAVNGATFFPTYADALANTNLITYTGTGTNQKFKKVLGIGSTVVQRVKAVLSPSKIEVEEAGTDTDLTDVNYSVATSLILRAD